MSNTIVELKKFHSILVNEYENGLNDESVEQGLDAYLNNLETCVSAYNKKQEFNGGLIEIQNIECRNFLKKIATDINSKIIITNEF